MDRRTLCVRGLGQPTSPGRPLSPSIVPATAHEFEDLAAVERFYEDGEGYLYARYGTPTVREAEGLLAALEGAEETALFSSGMAAISTLLLTVAGGGGGRIAAQREIYGSAASLLSGVLPGLGIEVLWLDRAELAELEPDRIRGCRLLYLETPINPTLRLVDLQRTTAAARAAGVPVAVDGTFAPPVLQRPLEHGADLVVHSATKYLGGHTDLLGGVVSGARRLVDPIAVRRRLLGGVLDAFSAFLLLRGLRTLALRMDTHCRNAEAVAHALAAHPRVEQVFYPGLPEHPDRAIAERQMSGPGGMVSFTVKDGADGAGRVHDSLQLFARAGTLGGVESLVSLPARMSHRDLGAAGRRRLGIPPGLVRLSVGVEAPGDLIADLERALA